MSPPDTHETPVSGHGIKPVSAIERAIKEAVDFIILLAPGAAFLSAMSSLMFFIDGETSKAVMQGLSAVGFALAYRMRSHNG